MSWIKKTGPGAIVAAAFIGPGTVTTASLAGSSYGYTLLWAILFSVIATCILQEMSVRLGVVAQLGVGEALRKKLGNRSLRIVASILVIGAITIGNAAYEAGNISGAGIGLEPLFSGTSHVPIPILIGLFAGLLLFVGTVKIIERALMFMVAIMGVVFIAAALILAPDLLLILKGLFIPSLPGKSVLMAIGLIGTTVVPYNLFLHASSVKKKWGSKEELKTARIDSFISIALGGLITMCILIAATAVKGGAGINTNLGILSESLTPIMGTNSTLFIGLGFLAAGLSSSITAPLAAAYATSEILGWESSLTSPRFRLVWLVIIIVGILFSSIGFKPTEVIVFAQIANGLLLPIVAFFLVWIMNDKELFGTYVNSSRTNMLGGLVILITVILGMKGIMSVF